MREARRPVSVHRAIGYTHYYSLLDESFGSVRIAFASFSIWGKFGGLHTCGATFSYIVALPNSSVKSIAFRNNIEREGLPRGSTPGLGAGGLRFKSGRPDHLPRRSFHLWQSASPAVTRTNNPAIRRILCQNCSRAWVRVSWSGRANRFIGVHVRPRVVICGQACDAHRVTRREPGPGGPASRSRGS